MKLLDKYVYLNNNEFNRWMIQKLRKQNGK